MRDLLQEVGWTNLGCVPNVPPTSIHLFSWNSLENKELCVENLNSPWCAEDGLQYVHLTSPQHVLIFHECHINENSLRSKGWNLRKEDSCCCCETVYFQVGGVIRMSCVLKVFISVTLRVQRRAHWLFLSNTVFIKEQFRDQNSWACSVFFMQKQLNRK